MTNRGIGGERRGRRQIMSQQDAGCRVERPGLSCQQVLGRDECRGTRHREHVLDLAWSQRFVDNDGRCHRPLPTEKRGDRVGPAVQEDPHTRS